MNCASLNELVKKNMVLSLNVKFPDAINCQICMKSKCTVKPFPPSGNRGRPTNKASNSGNLYFLTFIDNKSRYAFVYFIKTKTVVFNKFFEF